MPSPIHLTSVTNSRIKSALKLRDARHRRESGLFLAEGLREIERADAAGLQMCELYVCPERLPGIQPDHFTRPAEQCFLISPAILEKMAYRGAKAEGILAVFRQKLWSFADLEQELGRLDHDALVLVAVGSSKPGNLGAMVRSSDAAGADAVISCDGVVDFFNPNAIRASTGAIFTMPIVAGDASQTMDFLQRMKLRCLAATPHGSAAHTAMDLTGPAAIIIGAEDAGLNGDWLAVSEAVRIATYGKTVDSLNASVAAGVLLFEAVRQRGL